MTKISKPQLRKSALTDILSRPSRKKLDGALSTRVLEVIQSNGWDCQDLLGSFAPMGSEPSLQLSPKLICTHPSITDDGSMTYDHQDEKIAAVFVPGLRFSRKGLFRLGRGGGYFDRYFSQHPNVARIGVCYSFQLVSDSDWLPDPWDQPMDIIVTEQEICA